MSNKHFNIFTFKYLQQQKFVFIVPKQKKKRKRLKTKQILFFQTWKYVYNFFLCENNFLFKTS